MLYVKKLVGVLKAICFFLVVITFLLVVWLFSTWTFNISGTITPPLNSSAFVLELDGRALG